MKRFIFSLAIVVAVFISLFNYSCLASKQVEVEPVAGMGVDASGAAERLSRAIRFKTISYQDPAKLDAAEFRAFHAWLEKAFPQVHRTLKREAVNGLSLLYTWEGEDPGLAPVLLLAHIDVVPVAAGTEGDWTHPGFSGEIAEGYIWGRGAMDDKVSLMGLLEACEALLEQGFTPARTIYLAFGHDEEVGGRRGAGEIAALLESRGVKAEFLLDEGGSILTGIVPGVSGSAALIGIAEKGYMTVELVVEDEGGHSSMPPPHTAIGILATAIHKLEKNQFPARLAGPARTMFDYVAPEMEGYMKYVLGNPALFGPLIKSRLVKSRSTNAAIRTTTAVTMIEAGTKENVLPQEARAVVNFRLMPGDSRQDVLDHIEKTVGDPRVKVNTLGESSREASSVSDIDSTGYKTVEKTIRQVFPEVIVAPMLFPAGTDTKHYGQVTDTLLRFKPSREGPDDLKRAHGTDERVGVEDYEEIITFYAQVMKNSGK